MEALARSGSGASEDYVWDLYQNLTFLDGVMLTRK